MDGTVTRQIPMVVIAGAGSGVGKTSLAIGLVASLRRRGLRIQTFKVGPDYLDPTYLAEASGRPCYNLDGWMTSREYVERLVAAKVRNADAAVVEGVMGLYDGASMTDFAGSTAELAGWLRASALLVINAHGAGRSTAAVVNGFTTFRDAPCIAGVIANHVGSSSHEQGIRSALAGAGLPPLIGALPRGSLPSLPSRHLGLVAADSRTLSADMLSEFADACDRHIDIDAILSLKWSPSGGGAAPAPAKACVRIGLAMDEAFHFYYRDNLELLEEAGATVVPFSPLRDSELPGDLDALWVGGGYPEEHAAILSANKDMCSAIARFARSGRPLYAECGGLMYLAESITDRKEKTWPMLGILPARVRMLPRLKRLGYAAITLRETCLWGTAGERLRGHEFHYSETDRPILSEGWRNAYEVTYRNGTTGFEGLWNGRIMASYVHLHLASRPAAARSFVAFLKGDRSG